MAYDPIVLRRASARLEEARRLRQDILKQKRDRLWKQLPELADIDRQLRRSAPDVIRTCLKAGTDPQPALREIREKNRALQARQAQLLQEQGLDPHTLDDTPACPACGDTGWIGARMCSCLRKLYAQEQVKELSKLLDLGEQSFDRFSLEWYSTLPWAGALYSPRENMRAVLALCRDYAQNFGRCPFHNLLLTGAPGLGKTFLSACIAREVAEKGWSVVYDTAVSIFSRFEDRKFSRDLEEEREAQGETRRYLSCDLLILDDLGSEMTTPFVQSALYTLVNTRLVKGKRTVISSNLSPEAMRLRYSAQITSRLEGEYQVLSFYGEDIRRQKKQQE